MNSSLYNSNFSLAQPLPGFQNDATKPFSTVSKTNPELYPGFSYSSPLLHNNGLKFNTGCYPSQNSFVNGSRCDFPAFSTVHTNFESLCMHQKSQNLVNSSLQAHNTQLPRSNSLFAVLQNAYNTNTRLSPSIHHQSTWNTSLCVDLSAPVLKNFCLSVSSVDESRSQSQPESSVSSATFNIDSALKIKCETSDSGDSSRLSDDEVEKVFSTKRIKKQNICGHHDKEHYAKGLCNHCYRRFGRNKKPWACSHQKLYANGLCQRCYTGKYKKQRAIERKNLANSINKLV